MNLNNVSRLGDCDGSLECGMVFALAHSQDSGEETVGACHASSKNQQQHSKRLRSD
jgi:hypothetical protein